MNSLGFKNNFRTLLLAKIKFGARLFVAFLFLHGTEVLAGANCLQAPISPSDWATYGNSGGPCRVSSGYKWRQISLDGGKWVFHHGIDYACKVGTPIYAAVDGIAYQDTSFDGGNHVVRQISEGLNSRLGKNIKVNYYHNSAWGSPHGANVKSGGLIAKVGNEGGRSTGPHLHFEVDETSRSVFTPGAYAQEKLGAGSACDNKRLNSDGTFSCSNMRSIDPNTLMCPGYPSYSPLDALDPPTASAAPLSEDRLGDGTFSSARPGETPPPAPSGLGQESTRADLANDVNSRRANTEYLKQLATLSDISIFRELTYMESVSARISMLKTASNERKEALNAAILALKTQMLKVNIEKQKNIAASR